MLTFEIWQASRICNNLLGLYVKDQPLSSNHFLAPTREVPQYPCSTGMTRDHVGRRFISATGKLHEVGPRTAFRL